MYLCTPFPQIRPSKRKLLQRIRQMALRAIWRIRCQPLRRALHSYPARIFDQQ